MIKPGTTVFSTTDDEQGPQEARDFCKSRGLTGDNARIIKRNNRIEVETKIPCLLTVSKTPSPKS